MLFVKESVLSLKEQKSQHRVCFFQMARKY